jgi:hypothetical protein
MTRLAFLKTLGAISAMGCGLAAAVRALPGHVTAAQAASSTECGAAAFATLLHSRFRVSDDAGHRADLELTHVHEFACDPSLEQFSLVFEGAPPVLLEGICRFDHPAFGRQTLFITAGDRTDSARAVYQASFSRRRVPDEA